MRPVNPIVFIVNRYLKVFIFCGFRRKIRPISLGGGYLSALPVQVGGGLQHFFNDSSLLICPSLSGPSPHSASFAMVSDTTGRSELWSSGNTTYSLWCLVLGVTVAPADSVI